MSSLSAQLNKISEKTASIALDRKSRSKLHSRSLIFDPKTAAGQDYDFIYSYCLEGFEELCNLDSRFQKFHATLFSETSINTDRNVQSKDVVDSLNKNIEVFLTLVGQYWLLSPAARAVEWLVRRFHANVHNGEMMLLLVLPYYKSPVFVKCMNVIPKGNDFPAIFQWLSGYREQLRSPTSTSLVKAFVNFEFFKFYNAYLVESLKTRTAYKDQLVLYLSCSVQVVASFSKDLARFQEDGWLSLIVEGVGQLLVSRQEHQFSLGVVHDCKLTAYSIVSVLSSIVPLSQVLIESITKSIVSDPRLFEHGLKRQTLIVLGQIWSQSSAKRGFPTCHTGIDKHSLKELSLEGYKVNKLIILYVLSDNSDNDSKWELLDLISLENDVIFKELTQWLLLQLATNYNNITDFERKLVVAQFKKLMAQNLALFKTCLNEYKSGYKVSDLEMSLMTSLGDNLDNSDDMLLDMDDDEIEDIDEDAVDGEQDFGNTVVSTAAPITPTGESFLYKSAPFKAHLAALLAELSSQPQNTHRGIISKFSQSSFESVELSISFFIRAAFTPAVPYNVRLLTLRFIKLRLKELSGLHTYDFYLLIPIILLGLFDKDRNIRAYFVEILKVVQSVSLEKNKKTTLFMEEAIYNGVEQQKRSIISPADALKLQELLNDDIIKDVVLDSSQLQHILEDNIYKPKTGGKKFGQLFKTFILTQWGLDLHITFKDRCWKLSDDCKYFFDNDFVKYQSERDSILALAEEAGLAIESVEDGLFNLVGKGVSTSDYSTKSVNWLIDALASNTRMQQVADAKIIQVFEDIKSLDLKLKIVTKYIDLLVNDISLEIDPIESLQTLTYSRDLVLNILKLVQISTQIPEQGVPKRRRRSSSSTKQALARDDINNMASTHLKKLTIVLDLLETILKKEHRESEGEDLDFAAPTLLQSLFKSLTDLDYLGNDGNLPVLYAQETLARCMLLTIVQMKKKGKSHSFDSNSVRADLIVNCIRSSQSPQVQNRLLLVIAELASLAPEIILHSVMPIFTFMGAHTIRQDDEFLNSVLQQTISKVIPAIASNGSSSMSDEIEFLLTSFAAAFQHIPRHRRVKLFTTLAKTLGYDKLLDIILFLMGQQYSKNGSASVVEFSQSLLRQFSAKEQLTCFTKFFNLWSLIPDQPLENGSEKFTELSSRSIFGAQILALSKTGLSQLKSSLLKFVDELLAKQEFEDFSDLKLKVAFNLKDDEANSNNILEPFRNSISFLLTSLEQYNNENSIKISNNLYKLLPNMLDLLPISFFIDSIIEPLNESQSGSPVSVRVARNLCILAGTKIETELNSNNIDAEVEAAILDRLLPAIIANIDASVTIVDVELQQALLGTFSTIVEKMGSSSEKLSEPKYSKTIIDSLKCITGEKGLLSTMPEVIILSINAISSIVNVLGVKVIGFFPKIIPPVLSIWKKTDVEVEGKEDEVSDSDSLLQTSILVLLSCFIKKMPAFMNSTLDSTLLTILNSNLVDTSIRSNVLQIIIQQMDEQHILKTLCKIWSDSFHLNDNVANLGLYVNTMQLTIDSMEKKTATSQATTFVKWLISAFEFREEAEAKFDNNTIRRLESSFHSCGISYVMKLNDKTFRPLFAQIVRWATTGEGSTLVGSATTTRLLAFFKFFNKLQEQLKSIVTSYYTYLVDPVAVLLEDFASLKVSDINLRRVVLNSLTSSFKYDQDDFWSTQLRFETIFEPLLSQLYNIEDSIGKYIVKAITSFIVNVSSDEYNEKLVHGMINRISNENDQVNSQCKIWSIRTLKSIFQKMGDQWLTYLPTLIPYIAELLEDDDEEVELEVRKGLVRVIENVLGEPLDRYLD